MVKTLQEIHKRLEDTVTVVTDKKVQFRDTGIYLQSNADGKLTISSDGTGTDDITISGTTTFDAAATFSSDLTINGSLTFGDAAIDTLIIKGRVSTMTAAGSAISIGATYTNAEGAELRWTITDWTLGDSFQGIYARTQADTVNASGTLRGMELYGVANDVGVSALVGLLSYAYIKGATAATIGNAYGVHAELSFDAGASTKTITTEATPLMAKITGGVVDTYTKIHGFILRSGDMDGASRTYGNGILIEDDSAMSGTITWTKGISITQACTTSVAVSGTTNTAFDVTGMTSGTNTDGSFFKAGTLSTPIALNTAGMFGFKVFCASTATTGDLTCSRFRAIANAASGTPGAIGVLAQGSIAESKFGGTTTGLRAEGIAKASATSGVLHTSAIFKVEDARGTDGTSAAPTYSGRVSVMEVIGQISADPTDGYVAMNFDANSTQGGVSTSQAWDAVFRLQDEGQTNNTLSLIQTGATIATLGSNSAKAFSSGSLTGSGAADVACDARVRCDIGGTSYWIPLFDTAA